MNRMSARTIAALQDAVEDQAVIGRYLAFVSTIVTERGCRLWTGAVSSKGHGQLDRVACEPEPAVAFAAHRPGPQTAAPFSHDRRHERQVAADDRLVLDRILQSCDRSCRHPVHQLAASFEVSLFLCFTKARTSLADTPHSVALVSTVSPRSPVSVAIALACSATAAASPSSAATLA